MWVGSSVGGVGSSCVGSWSVCQVGGLHMEEESDDLATNQKLYIHTYSLLNKYMFTTNRCLLSNIMLSNIMLSNIMLYNMMLYNIMLYNMMLYNIMLYNIMLYNIMLYNIMLSDIMYCHLN